MADILDEPLLPPEERPEVPGCESLPRPRPRSLTPLLLCSAPLGAWPRRLVASPGAAGGLAVPAASATATPPWPCSTTDSSSNPPPPPPPALRTPPAPTHTRVTATGAAELSTTDGHSQSRKPNQRNRRHRNSVERHTLDPNVVLIINVMIPKDDTIQLLATVLSQQVLKGMFHS